MTDGLPEVTLALNENSHRRVVEVLRAAHLHIIADLYEEQLPLPPEPTGDVVVRLSDHDRSDVWLVRAPAGGWFEVGATQLSFTSWPEVLAWAAKWAHGPLRVFRPEPSGDA